MSSKLLASFLFTATTVFLVLGGADAQGAAGRTRGYASVSDSGQATYSIPLYTPPGTNGVAPQLSLNYSHGAGNGLFGVGWALSGLSGISRCASTWVQDGIARNPRNDPDDKFCLDGQKLRLVSGVYGQAGSTYSTEIESFSRITAYGTSGNGPTYFTAETKEGLVYEYGATEDSRIQSVGQTTVRFWAVNRVRDRSAITNGNAIIFTYLEDTANGAFRISTIRYTENTSQGVTGPYTVTFGYEDLPIGEIDNKFGMGSQILRIYRAKQVDVTHSGGTLIRRYILAYEAALSNTKKSRLASIQECAGSGPDCFPATIFTYQNSTAGLSTEAVTSGSMPALWPIPMDVNGDGREDIAYSSTATSGTGTWQVMFGNTSGSYGAAVNTGITNTNYLGSIVIDYNADGLEDLLVPYSGGTWWVMLGTTSGFAAPTNTGAPATNTGSNARAFDVNGDGLDDLVWAEIVGWGGGDVIRYRLRVWGGAFSSTVTNLIVPKPANSTITSGVFQPLGRKHLSRRPDFNGDGRGDLTYLLTQRVWTGDDTGYVYVRSVQAVCPGAVELGASVGPGATFPQFMDINGDGLTDLLYSGGTMQFRFRFSTGNGFTQEYLSSSITGHWGEYPTVIDWDGDGFEDIVTKNTVTNTFHVWRSKGTGFESPINTGLSTANVDSITATDINGDGLADLGYRKSGVWASRPHAGLYPDLLLTAVDAFGVSDTFSYASLPMYAYFNKTSGSVYPMQDIAKPMMVVSNLQSSDGTSPSSTYSLHSFYYEGARIDLQGRGFLGFSYRTWIDSRDSTAQRRNYSPYFPYIGAVTNARRTQEPSGTVINENQITYANHSYGSGYAQRWLPYPSQVTQLHRNVGPSYNGALLSSSLTTNTVDPATGLTTNKLTTVTEPSSGANGLSPGATWTEQVSVSSIFTDTTNWCIGRPSQMARTRSHSPYGGGTLERTSSATWNGSYCRPTQLVEEPLDPDLEVTTGLAYDNFGNPLSVTVTGVGMSARTTSFVYAAGQFPTQVTNALGEVTNLSWNSALAVPASTTDANLLTTSWQYDAFARRTRETRPDTTFTTWDYATCPTCDSRVKISVDEKVNISNPPPNGTMFYRSTRYFDQFERSIYEYALRRDNYYNITTRSFDSLGRVITERFPYSSAGSSAGYATIAYDLLHRPTSISRPISDAPGSASQITTFSYNGLTTLTTDPQSVYKTIVHDAVGRVSFSQDHALYGQYFDFDAFGNVVRVTDTNGNPLQSSTYNDRGMLKTRTDMDMGTWTFNPNALGEVLNVRDAKTGYPYWTQTLTYDPLGRLTSRRDEPEASTSYFNFGTSSAAKNIGRLASMTGAGYSEYYSYDSLARPSSTTINADAAYQIDYAYNDKGLLDSLTYPTSTSSYRLKLKYGYTNGLLSQISDFNVPATVFWSGNSFNARGQITGESLANGLTTNRAYDAITGWLKTIQTGPSGGAGVQNLEYTWDKLGNLTSRKDLNQSGLTETFYYDNLYRVDYSQRNSVQNLDLAYDALGNITSKSDIGTYTYHATKKHQVVSTSNGWSFSYDANGNMLNGLGTARTWTSYNLPSSITNGSLSSTFSYTPDRRYWRQVANYASGSATTVYIAGLLEKITNSGVTDYRYQIQAGGARIIVARATSGTNATYYVTRDHLGSNVTITNSGGGVMLNTSFDAFGARRATNWQGLPTVGDYNNIANVTRRGFTDHTHLDNLGLIHMNGRVYNPALAKFVSADPYIFELTNTQNYNRYSYVFNNPLSLSDPSGFHAGDPDTCCDSGPGILGGGGMPGVYRDGPRRPPNGYLCDGHCPSPKFAPLIVDGGCDSAQFACDGDVRFMRASDVVTATAIVESAMADGVAGLAIYKFCSASARNASACGLAAGLVAYAVTRDTTEQAVGDDEDSKKGTTASHTIAGASESATQGPGQDPDDYDRTPYKNRSSDQLSEAQREGLVNRLSTSDGGLYVSATVDAELASSRAYVSNLAIRETIMGGVRYADVQGVAGQYMYRVNAGFQGRAGVLEVLVNEDTNVITHVLYRSL